MNFDASIIVAGFGVWALIDLGIVKFQARKTKTVVKRGATPIH